MRLVVLRVMVHDRRRRRWIALEPEGAAQEAVQDECSPACERNAMITVTRMNDRAFVLNADLIKMVESTPDTIITLVGGDHILVKESVDEVVRRAVDYGRAIRAFAV